jgi:anti-sigma factor ChrR (cupin superfamily)
MSGSGPHPLDRDYVELVSLYAVDALPEADIPVVEAHLAGCAECRSELEALRSVVDAFVTWPTDVLRPAPSLWERLAGRIEEETGHRPAPRPRQSAEPEWEEAARGIWCKVLSTDTDNNRVSMLVRLAPGTAYPPHQHSGVEELYLLDGELWIDDKKLYPGDYNRAEAGSADQRVWSKTGCTCVLLTSVDDVIL